MVTKISVILAAVATFAQVVTATPPGCMLAALNSQSNPGDVSSMCGSNSGAVQSAIQSMCTGNMYTSAMNAYSNTCLGAGKTVSLVSGSVSVTASASGSAASSGAFYPSGNMTSGFVTGTAAGSDSYPSATGATGTGSGGVPGSNTGSGSPGASGSGSSGSGSGVGSSASAGSTAGSVSPSTVPASAAGKAYAAPLAVAVLIVGGAAIAL